VTLGRLISREILHNKLGFIVGLMAVTVAVGVLVAELTILDAHDVLTEHILAVKEREIEAEMARMEDDYRKIMKELGFNLLILPKDQRLDNFYDTGYASNYMPEDYVSKLAASNIVTIRHLLPSLESKVRWPEQGNRSIILIGTRGEVPFLLRDPKEPILLAVPPGKIVLGYELWNSLGLKKGDRLRLLGRTFEVDTCYPQRGSKDDITAWIDLAASQEMLDREGLINGILALKCICANNDIASIRTELATILPETQIIELENKVTTREKARLRAKAIADSTLAAERTYRARLRSGQESFASLIIPLVIIGSTALIGFLAFNNVRERRPEIGILRALGLRSRQILGAFLGKAVLMGCVGAVAGYAVGFAVAMHTSELPQGTNAALTLFNPVLLIVILAASPLLSSFASWVPALIAARQDPAEILSEE